MMIKKTVALLLLLATTHAFEVPKSSRSISFLRAEDPTSIAKKLRDQAERLRRDVEAMEKEKQAVVDGRLQEERQIMQEKQELRDRYSAEIPILKGDGSEVVERVDFPPRFKNDLSSIQTCEASLPLGIILGESEDMPGLTVVDDVLEESNGEASGIQVGDILRACTACQTMMKTPTWQIIAGGIGIPETRRFMYNVDGRPFEEVMDAIGSNRMDPLERPVLLVLERKA